MKYSDNEQIIAKTTKNSQEPSCKTSFMNKNSSFQTSLRSPSRVNDKIHEKKVYDEDNPDLIKSKDKVLKIHD